MALTLAQARERFAQALVSDLPGLNINVARAWAAAEVGTERLSLGTGGANGPSYPTPEAGAQAAATEIKSNPLYAGIRSSLSSTNPNVQATAIAQSPWHLGAIGLKRAGGTDPYYSRIFSGFGLQIGASPAKAPASPSTDTGTPGNSPVVNAQTGFTTGQTLGAWGNIIGFPEGHKITQADVDAMIAKLDAAGYFKSDAPGAGDIGKQITRAILQTTVGKTWNKALQDQLQGQFMSAATTSGNALNPLNTIIPALGIAVGRFFLIIGGVLLIGIGIWIVVRQDAPPLKVLEGGKVAAVA